MNFKRSDWLFRGLRTRKDAKSKARIGLFLVICAVRLALFILSRKNVDNKYQSLFQYSKTPLTGF